MAKGLEFDAVVAYEVDEELLYIASTRALHRLSLLDARGEVYDIK